MNVSFKIIQIWWPISTIHSWTNFCDHVDSYGTYYYRDNGGKLDIISDRLCIRCGENDLRRKGEHTMICVFISSDKTPLFYARILLLLTSNSHGESVLERNNTCLIQYLSYVLIYLFLTTHFRLELSTLVQSFGLGYVWMPKWIHVSWTLTNGETATGNVILFACFHWWYAWPAQFVRQREGERERGREGERERGRDRKRERGRELHVLRQRQWWILSTRKYPVDALFSFLINLYLIFYTATSYNSLDELQKGLLTGEVDGILLDAYVVGSRQDLFGRPDILVNRIKDYRAAYGIVWAGKSSRMRVCLNWYVKSRKEKMFSHIVENLIMAKKVMKTCLTPLWF